jgi:hypothetical protein
LAPASLSGLGAVVTEEGLSEGFSLYFGTGTFSQSMLPGDDLENNSSGTYTYKVTGADTALLAVTPTAPPNKASGQATEVALTFTNAQGGGTYFATNHDGTVSSGALEFSTLANVAPSSLAGLTAYMTNSLNQTMRTVFTGSSFSSVNLITSSGGEGSFTFTRVSPASGLVKLSFTGPTIMDGYTGYTIVAFLTDTSGTWAQEIFNKKGKVANTDYGTFVTE